MLFELVDRITDVVGSPMPHEILVDSVVNASARLTHGAFSKGLTLTIGMPLIYGLDAVARALRERPDLDTVHVTVVVDELFSWLRDIGAIGGEVH